MGWFRRQGFAAWLALFALALQLVLSFGHVHGFADPRPAVVAAQATDPAPASGPGDEDYCAICAVLAMLGGAQAASAPDIGAPAALRSAEVVAVVESSRRTSLPTAFRSRAPPLS